jgi:50S ribosomal protein L16 3-hydroxylase
MPQRPLDHPILPAAPTASDVSPPPPDAPTPLFANLTPSQFMRRYWQKKPLLVRQAMPGVAAPLSRDELLTLAGNDDVESRLVTHFRGKWQLAQGPFDIDDLPRVKRREWTLLVQGVDLHNDRARALLERFRFIPDARLDDLMISYATDGGGVGPHFDSYDVFLLQVHGKRRWRISAQKDLALKDGLPLKVLQHFTPDEEWVLEPGDMLYLPPHIAHDGVALGECMTCSIGFRSPSARELIGQFLYHLAERGSDASGYSHDGMRNNSHDGMRYRDPDQDAVARPAQLPPALIGKVGSILAGIRWSDEDVASFIGSYLSEPKANVVFDPPKRPASAATFARQAERAGIRLDRKTALLYGKRSYFINGEEHRLPTRKKWLTELADNRRLEGKRFVTLSQDWSMTALLHEWYLAGWVRIGALA